MNMNGEIWGRDRIEFGIGIGIGKMFGGIKCIIGGCGRKLEEENRVVTWDIIYRERKGSVMKLEEENKVWTLL